MQWNGFHTKPTTAVNLTGNGMDFQTEMLSHFVKSTMIFVKRPSHRAKNRSAVKGVTEQNYYANMTTSDSMTRKQVILCHSLKLPVMHKQCP